jgi:Fe-S cluster assembly protein SufD
MKTKAEQALTEAFEAVAGKLPGSAAVKERRAEAIGAFGSLGLPHRRIEEWKYTDLRANLKEALPPAIHDETPLTIAELIVALGPLAHVDAYRVAFVNGRHRAELDDTSEAAGLDVAALGKTLASASANVADTLTKSDANGAIAALNAAFMTDGAIVRVADKATLAKPLLVVFVRAGSGKHSVSVRNFVSIGKGATATIIEAHVVLPGAAVDAQSNALTEVTVG